MIADRKIKQCELAKVNLGDTLRRGKKRYTVVAFESYGKIRTERTIVRHDLITRDPADVVLTEYFFITDINTDLTLKEIGSGNKKDEVDFDE